MNSIKKLKLSTETVRNLTESEMKIVVGGLPVASKATDCDNSHCWGCPTTDGTKP